MSRELRSRLKEALERKRLSPERASVAPAMRDKLDRALAGSLHEARQEKAAQESDRLPQSPETDTLSSSAYTAERLADDDPELSSLEGAFPIPGREHETPAGSIFKRTWRVSLEKLTGAEALDKAEDGAGVLAALLDNDSLERFEPGRALYLDTETTGLAGGTGTYVFLLGLGWVEGNEFVVEQLFMRELSEEPALLHRCREIADRFSTIVSFNGLRFDIPLLDTRLVMNRMEGDLGARPHLDLLLPARHLYKGRFANCRLQTLEQELFGHLRQGDIPGAEIPGLYFDYLGGADVRNLMPVFEHNCLDVATLLSFAVHFLHLCGRPERDPRALGGMGRLHMRRGNRRRAQELLEEARRQREATYRDLRELGFLYKKQGSYGKALEIWTALVERQERAKRFVPFDVVPYVEAAKHFEHRAKDFARALTFTSAAGRRAAASGWKGKSPLRRSLVHRAERLRKRMEQA